MNSLKKTVLLLLILFLTGCSRALLFNNGLFSHTVEPLTFNREPTEVRANEKLAKGRITQFQYPLTTALSVRLGKNGIGDVAKEHGITTIYYADLERWSAAFGLWSSEIVHIYGQ
ncbi:MAG: hypothetical protein A2010_16015 [Nitrospirae bacterium GWD2_57_9]|nr:MAG: hypothetical protein A2010_16015 [Nitrospirae bacterium GWD2_57_9]OGW45403.1 MAG: hypothetical protein A2078_00085 [Nitrospirae bacterium GWC2_57_9]